MAEDLFLGWVSRCFYEPWGFSGCNWLAVRIGIAGWIGIGDWIGFADRHFGSFVSFGIFGGWIIEDHGVDVLNQMSKFSTPFPGHPFGVVHFVAMDVSTRSEAAGIAHDRRLTALVHLFVHEAPGKSTSCFSKPCMPPCGLIDGLVLFCIQGYRIAIMNHASKDEVIFVSWVVSSYGGGKKLK